MEARRATAWQGLVLGLAGIEATATLAASAARHAGWWVAWHTRPSPGHGCRGLDGRDLVPAALRVERIA